MILLAARRLLCTDGDALPSDGSAIKHGEDNMTNASLTAATATVNLSNISIAQARERVEKAREWHGALDDVWCALGDKMPAVLQDAYVDSDVALDVALDELDAALAA
jgi:hypothetical protein